MTAQAADPRRERIANAVRLEPVDHVPVVLEGVAWSARVSGMTLQRFLSDPLLATQANIDAFNAVGNADSVNNPTFDVSSLSFLWMTRVKRPGKELGEDELWQVEESGLMLPEDYERIVAEGWGPFQVAYLNERIAPGTFETFLRFVQGTQAVVDKATAADMPFLSVGVLTTPFEYLCGGRSFSQFVFDLYRTPDRVEAAMQAMMPGLCDGGIGVTKAVGCPGIWIGGWRSASKMLSQPLWDRFVFPYLADIVHQVADAGIIPILHLDSDWTRDLPRLLELPAKTCILSLDSMTDIRKAKEVLGDHMCIMGDVPPAVLSAGTPAEVYEHCRKLVVDVGPTGFILQSGCDIPVDAPLENVKAMVAAAVDG
jgi:uroporphyrinogen-III decarboxylase